MVRSELDDFFRDKAFAYTKGRLRHVALMFNYPCAFRMGSEVLRMAAPKDIEALFATYRDNLITQDYAQTRAELMHVSVAENGHMYCLVTYRNIDTSGDAISIEHACYFLERDTDGLFHIALAEFVDEPKADLLKGFEIARFRDP